MAIVLKLIMKTPEAYRILGKFAKFDRSPLIMNDDGDAFDQLASGQ